MGDRQRHALALYCSAQVIQLSSRTVKLLPRIFRLALQGVCTVCMLLHARS